MTGKHVNWLAASLLLGLLAVTATLPVAADTREESLQSMLKIQTATLQLPPAIEELLLATRDTSSADAPTRIDIANRPDELLASLMSRTNPEPVANASITVLRAALTEGRARCDCYCDAACDDGNFCREGGSVCGGYACTVTVPEQCEDFDRCTLDLCDVEGEQCLFEPVPASPEVETILLSKDQASPSIALLDWDSVSGAQQYNVYQGTTTNLDDLGCQSVEFESNYSDTGLTPDPGGLWIFLVTAQDCFESTLGNDSDGMPRVASNSCS